MGAVYPRSGSYATLGSQNVNAHRLAVDEINENGGINGVEIELIPRDSQLDPSVGTSEAQDLIRSEQVDILSGAVSSSVTGAMMQPASRNGIVLMNGSSAARSLTGENCSNHFFRFRLHIEQQAAALAPWLAENVGESMYIMFSDYAWGQSGLEQFTTRFEDAGGSVVGSVGAPLGTSDFSKYLTEVDESADILLGIFSGSDAAAWLNQTAEFGLSDSMVRAGLGSSLSNNLDATEGNRSDYKVVTEYPEAPFGPWDTEVNRSFIQSYRDRFGSDPIYHAGTAYSMVKSWAKAAREAEFASSDDTDALIGSLESLTIEEGEVPVGPGKMRASDHNIAYRQGVADVTTDYQLSENVSQDVADSVSAGACSL